MIYLDNAATSFPKPKEAIERLNDFVLNIGGNPGRSGHTLSLEAARIIFEAREKLTNFIGGHDSERLIFTQNGTESLNLAILGLLHQGDHVITTSMEHNSVMRPLTFLQKEKGIQLSVVQCSKEGIIDIDRLKSLLKKQTKAVIINHGSNVIGTVQPIDEVRKIIDDRILILDACQTIGSYPVDVEESGIDILCFSCHKSLYSIQGLGAVYMKSHIELTPLRFGGTGSKSESIEQPTVFPDKYESGTPNTPAIASLLGGLIFIENTGLTKIVERKGILRKKITEGLSAIEGIELFGPKNTLSVDLLPTVSFNLKNRLPSEVGYILNKAQIYTRIGLHCSPLAHKTIGTYPRGTVRVAPGYFTTDDDIERFLEVVRNIAES
ncbi:MAG: cysteine desulfurase [Syntrophus sp. (in: bacteria)]|nr:cysteine desulfurase [Syntrophus sp. (in: bacteria)]